MKITLLLPLALLASAGSPPVSPAAPSDPQDAAAHGHLDRRLDVHRLEQLVGTPLESAGRKLGRVEELVLEAGRGTVEYAVVAAGDTLDMDGKLFALPFSMLELRRHDDELCFHAELDPARVESAPKFAKDAWPELDQRFEQRVREHFGDRLERTQQTVRRLLRSDDVRDARVVARSDRPAGAIDRIAVDAASARVCYVVLRRDQERSALPWSLLSTSDRKDALGFAAAVDVAAMTDAPTFVPGEWERMSSEPWIRELYAYYSARPYWTQPMSVPEPAGAPARREGGPEPVSG